MVSPHQMEDSSALTMLEEVTTVESRQDVAMTLVKIYLGQGLVVPFLDYLNTREVNQTSKITEQIAEVSLIVFYRSASQLLRFYLPVGSSKQTVAAVSTVASLQEGHWFNQIIN